MIDNVAVGIIHLIVRFPVIYTANIQVVPQKIVANGIGSAKLVDGENIRFHIFQYRADVFILLLRVVVSLETTCPAAIVIAVFQQIVLHDGDGVLCESKIRSKNSE